MDAQAELYNAYLKQHSFSLFSYFNLSITNPPPLLIHTLGKPLGQNEQHGVIFLLFGTPTLALSWKFKIEIYT